MQPILNVTDIPSERFAFRETLDALEQGAVLYLPLCSFPLAQGEHFLLSPDEQLSIAKNISFNPQTNQIKGTSLTHKDARYATLQQMMKRYLDQAKTLIHTYLPSYAPHLITGRTSFRPTEIVNRKTSAKKDDKRLHVDAFAATPLQGKRILRVFCNIHPVDQPRVWQLGEPFEAVANRFMATVPPYRSYIAHFLHALKLTKTYRTAYDHTMLHIHDNMKKNKAYQAEVNKTTVQFPPGSTWITYTDITSHAALSGQFLLEQTFYLLPEKMQNPAYSPLNILQRLSAKALL